MSTMSRLSLGVWLATACIVVAALVIGMLTPTGWNLLETLARDDARARVELAAVSAAESLRERREQTLVDARILAERPTLARLVASRDARSLTNFLDTYRATAGLDACAVIVDGAVMAEAGDEFPWMENAAAGNGWAIVGANAFILAADEIRSGASGRVMVVRAADAEILSPIGKRLGLEVRLAHGEMAEPESGDLVAVRALDESASLSIVASLGEGAVEEALQPAREVLTTTVIVACVVAVGLGFLSARWISAPLQELQSAATRIGAGDLVTPVPQLKIGEAGPLSGAMEQMRRRLRELASEIARREAEAQALLSGIMEGVFAVDGNRVIRYLNPKAATLLGSDAAAVIGRFCGDVLHPLPDGGARPCDSSCPIVHARSRGGSRAVEHLDLPAGRRTVVLTSAPEASGRQVVLVRDETEVETARRSRDAVLANVSHELRTPLSAQLASIELLLDGIERLEREEVRQLVSSLQRSTLRMTRLIDNLLESVRIETASAPLRRVPVDIAAVVEDAMEMTVPLLRQKGQTITVDLDPDLAAVDGEPAPLVQVLVNLIANAHKYSPPDGVIRVEALRGGEHVEIRVDDDGPGVAGTASGSIFDRFSRAADEGEGMGLGLWIVKNIVERHGGSVDVAESPAGGARFVVRLPVSRQA